MKNAIFLDRDGVINIDYGYVHKVQNFDFMDNIFDLVSEAKKNGFLVIVITNQAGIGRGIYTQHDFQKLTDWMCDRFEKEGCSIDKVYFSPYHPKYGLGEYKKNHYSRKPNPGMIIQAIEEFKINPKNSILIGDKVSDIIAGNLAGVGTNILLNYRGKKDISSLKAQELENINDVIKFLKELNSEKKKSDTYEY